MNRDEFRAALQAIKALPSGERDPAYRKARSERRKALYRERRQRDPEWWERQKAYVARYRRMRAANDDDYRHLRNAQAK